MTGTRRKLAQLILLMNNDISFTLFVFNSKVKHTTYRNTINDEKLIEDNRAWGSGELGNSLVGK